MKLYRRHLDITPQQEMHLQVDHYLEPVEITEEEITKVLFHVEEDAVKEDEDVTIMEVFNLQAKAIIELLNQKI
jgi:hypothetical protein